MGSTGPKTGDDSNHLIELIRLWRVRAGGDPGRSILVSRCFRISTVEDVRSVVTWTTGTWNLGPVVGMSIVNCGTEMLGRQKI